MRRFERAVSKTLGSGGDKQAGNRKSGSQKTTQNHRIGVLTKPLPTSRKKANFFCFFFPINAKFSEVCSTNHREIGKIQISLVDKLTALHYY